MFKAHREKIRCHKRQMASHQFIGNAPQSVLVPLFADDPLELLRGHVGWRSPDRRQVLNTGGREHGSNTKICQEHVMLRVEEDVFWLEISMNDVTLVSIVECLANLGKHRYRLLKGQRCLTRE